MYEINKIAEDVSKGDQHIIRLVEEKYTPVVEFYKLKMSSYRNGVKIWTEGEIMPRRVDFPEMGRVAEVLIEAIGRDMGKSVTVAQFETSPMSNSTRIKGKQPSVQFSFDPDKN